MAKDQFAFCFTNCSSELIKDLIITSKLVSFKKKQTKQSFNNNNNYNKSTFVVVMFLGNDAEICQIAATDGNEDFNVYVMPKHGISAGASAVNRLYVKNNGLV